MGWNANPKSTRSAWLVSGLLVLLVVVSFVLSAMIGSQVGDADGDFNWELFAVLGTAFGTSLLALVTGLLAIITGEDVRANRNVAHIAREEQVTRREPIVLVETVGFRLDEGRRRHRLEIALRNVGQGPALRGSLEVRYREEATTLATGEIYASSLMSGETKIVEAVVTSAQPIRATWVRSDWLIRGRFFDATSGAHALLDGQAGEPEQRVTVTT